MNLPACWPRCAGQRSRRWALVPTRSFVRVRTRTLGTRPASQRDRIRHFDMHALHCVGSRTHPTTAGRSARGRGRVGWALVTTWSFVRVRTRTLGTRPASQSDRIRHLDMHAPHCVGSRTHPTTAGRSARGRGRVGWALVPTRSFVRVRTRTLRTRPASQSDRIRHLDTHAPYGVDSGVHPTTAAIANIDHRSMGAPCPPIATEPAQRICV